MKGTVLNDKNIKPSEEFIASILGDVYLLWEQLFAYFCDSNVDTTIEWKYTCGNEWSIQALKKKKTIFWVGILCKHSFGVGFPFSASRESLILESKLPNSIKDDFINAKSFGSTKYISIQVGDSNDLENVKTLIDLKVN